MSSRKKYLIILLLLVVSFGGCSTLDTLQINTKPNIMIIPNNSAYNEENLDILYALEFQKQGHYGLSAKMFQKLYKNTKNSEYLYELIMDLYETKQYSQIVKLIKNNVKSDPRQANRLNALLVRTYLKMERYKDAEKIGLILLKNDPNLEHLELMAKIYYRLKEFPKSYKYTIKAYNMQKSQQRALSVVNLLYKKLNKAQQAIEFLENYAKTEQCTLPVCSNLLFMYTEQNDLDGTIKMLQKIYNHFKTHNNKQAMKQSARMIVQHLEQKNDNLAMIFLESERTDDQRLIQLYKKHNKIDQAIKLMNNIYKETSDINIIAQIAILEFESAKDKSKVLTSVIKKFKDTLALVDDAVYQNYLGYILIDFDINIEEGINLVKLALEKDPTNYAYIDSLAWGEYKLNNCKSAYKHMKKVVDEVGLKDEEIILHWNKIKECIQK